MKLIQSDCLIALQELQDNSIDALVTDPPAGISFMGKDWDSAKGGREPWIAWMESVMRECLRVLKPGAHGLVWALPRTSHWTATALENAGFEIRDVITHLFGTGFPKSLNISKAIDREAGAEREIVGSMSDINPRYATPRNQAVHGGGIKSTSAPNITAPATDLAKQYSGWGTALKPASEHWILIRKPISEKTVAANVQRWGVGGINIDECRIPMSQSCKDEILAKANKTDGQKNFFQGIESLQIKSTKDKFAALPLDKGRFPANLVLDEEAAAMLDEQSGISKSNIRKVKPGEKISAVATYHGSNEINRVEGGVKDSGASRFFYVAKASRSERNAGLGGMPEKYTYHDPSHTSGEGGLHINSNPRCLTCGKEKFHRINVGKCECESPNWKLSETKPNKNHHPTVKTLALMTYLCRLITPPGGTILDPFMGSGSTGLAAKALGAEFIGIEREADYFAIAEKRIAAQS